MRVDVAIRMSIAFVLSFTTTTTMPSSELKHKRPIVTVNCARS